MSIQYIHGNVDPSEYYDDPALYNALVKYNALEQLVNFCFEHITDSAKPIQDLVDKGLIDGS